MRSRITMLCSSAIVGLALAGCGSGGGDAAAFRWLHPAPAPRGWRLARLPDGSATMAYPAAWHRERSDPHTVAAVVETGSGSLLGYLNATPQQGAETFENWADFRVAHNADEGDRRVRAIASAQHLGFRDGASGSCVIDRYVTESRHPYREIACLVGSASATTVIVGAAPPSRWRRIGPQLQRAISAFST